MIPGLVVALSAVGLGVFGWLLRLPAWQSARDLAPYDDDPAVIRFGFDHTGIVD